MNLYEDEAIIRNVSYSASGGHKVTLEVDPEGWEALKAAGVSTRCAMVLVEIDNDDKPVAQPRKTKTRAQMAGIYCNDPRFWEYLRREIRRGVVCDSPEHAASIIRDELQIASRAYIDTDPTARRGWDIIANGFRAYTGQSGEPDR